MSNTLILFIVLSAILTLGRAVSPHNDVLRIVHIVVMTATALITIWVGFNIVAEFFTLVKSLATPQKLNYGSYI